MHVLVTGAAGFIGFHFARLLLEEGHSVVGLDNLNEYYSVALKQDRLNILRDSPRFRFVQADLTDLGTLETLFSQEDFSHVVNLAAQAGVRHSLDNPHVYIQANLVGFTNLLECCRAHKPEHLLYASSSSVYGLNTRMPFSVEHGADHPASLYAATKRSNELIAHSYSHLFDIAATGLRFFTVYGPWGRPDMALFSFTRDILNKNPIRVFNHGNMQRDFTYIDDITEAMRRILTMPPKPDPAWDSTLANPATSSAPFRIYNIGNNNPVRLEDFIDTLEQALGVAAIRQYLPLQAGDVAATWADVDDLYQTINFRPQTNINQGVAAFVDWYTAYYKA